MKPKASRMICWPAPNVACLRGECGFCYAGRRIKCDTIRRYARGQDMLPAHVFGTRNPKVRWQAPDALG